MRIVNQSDPWLPARLTVIASPASGVSTTQNGQADHFVEVTVGVDSLPYLADHGVSDMTVLPGSFSIELARSIHRELFKNSPAILRTIAFDNPLVLSDRATKIAVRVRDSVDHGIEYTFYEATAEEVRSDAPPRHFVRLEIDRESAMPANAVTSPENVFQKLISLAAPSEAFYKKLRQNGNQYGPEFQNLSAIAAEGGQVVAKLKPRLQHGHDGPGLHPALLDSMTQSLSALVIEEGMTFMLTSIESIEIADLHFPEALWAHAKLRPRPWNERKGYIGDVRVLDTSGKVYLELVGVEFTLLEHLSEAPGPESQTAICVASTFSAEPLEDSFKFWAAHFGTLVDVRFAPYNQVFQQLLDPESLFHQNRAGFNVVLLSLLDWLEKDRPTLLSAKQQNALQHFAANSRSVLPNGIEIAQWNRYETDYLYREIFEDQCYLRHGIRLKDGDTVVDIGANIGLFSLFVMSRSEHPTIYAFEPSPELFKLLQANLNAYGENAYAFNRGVSDSAQTAQFTFYENSSVFSGFYAKEQDDKEAVETVVRNVLLEEAQVERESVDAYVGELTRERLRSRTYECQMTTVSDIIRENRIERIQLLKIDAEKSELDVIKGIEERHWPLIDQIVIEIHDKSGTAVRTIEHILRDRGFQCAVVEEKLLEGSGLFNVYASREKLDESVANGPRSVEDRLTSRVDEFCSVLRSFRSHSTAPLILAVAPGKSQPNQGAEIDEVLKRTEHELLSRTRSMVNIHFIDSDSMLDGADVLEYFDSHSHELGHVPYTPHGYTALGTRLFRMVFNLSIKPFKVIVLDCDNTLWKGTCAEDGPLGVELTEPYAELQEFMVRQFNAGMLICICSKNREQDVFEVFDQRQDMALRREHLAGWRVNWNRKSENLQSLADELNVGLDTFIFIDDNPVECEEVRARCPKALVLELPQKSDSFPTFLKNVWVFDRVATTREDLQRTKWYQQNAERETFRRQELSLKDFLARLNLHMDLTEAADSQLERVSQLTRRTSQFNFTTIRRSESEVRSLLREENKRCLVASVSDRFGDYGLVGVVIYEAEKDQYTVDTFLLSCRALGKGVEHRMLSELGRRAENEGKALVRIQFVATERNRPALEFARRIGEIDEQKIPGALSFNLSASKLAQLEYELEEADAAREFEEDAEVAGEVAESALPRFGERLSERMQEIGDSLHGVRQVAAAIEVFRLKTAPSAVADLVPPGNATEEALVAIWKKVLARTQVGINENFFDAGGTSLKAVQVVATIKRELGKTLSIIDLFECPSIRLAAAKLDADSRVHGKAPETSEAELRGRRRRQKLVRRGPQ